MTDSDIVDIVKSMHTNIEREEEKEEINEEKINDNNKSNVCDCKTNGILNSFDLQICKRIF